MKLLVVGHTYLTAFAQSKYVAMKAAHPELELRLVVPPKMPHPFMVFAAERHPALALEEVVVIPVLGGRDHMSYVFNPWRLASVLRAFAPDHVHIEEDPHSAAGFETTMLAWISVPGATVSFFIWDNLARTPRFPLNWVKFFLTRIALARAQLVICGNSEGRDLLRSVKRYRGRAAVLPQLGIDERDYESRSEEPGRGYAAGIGPRIGFLGRLVPEKGITDLLEALTMLMDLPWQLLVVGSGPLEENIRGSWQERFGERLVCMKAVPHAQVPQLLRSLDIFVLPSYQVPEWKEQYGLTLAQAMLSGAACVGTRSGAIPEVIGTAGVLVPERAPVALAAAIRELCSSSQLRKRLGAAARTRAMAHFRMATVAETHFQLFVSLSESNDSPSP